MKDFWIHFSNFVSINKKEISDGKTSPLFMKFLTDIPVENFSKDLLWITKVGSLFLEKMIFLQIFFLKFFRKKVKDFSSSFMINTTKMRILSFRIFLRSRISQKPFSKKPSKTNTLAINTCSIKLLKLKTLHWSNKKYQ